MSERQNTIEKHFRIIKDGVCYSLESENEFIRTLFITHFMHHFLLKDEKVLYLTDAPVERLFKRASSYRMDLRTFFENEKLLVLEIPDEIKHLSATVNNISLILNDLKVYIDAFKPHKIVIDGLNSIIPNKKSTDYSVVINRIAFFFRTLSVTLLLGLNQNSNLLKQDFSNIIQSSIKVNFGDFQLSRKNKIIFESSFKGLNQYEINYRIKNNMGMTEVFDIENTNLMGSSYLRRVIIHSSIKFFDEIANEILEKKIVIDRYTFSFELEKIIEDEMHTMILIPDYFEDVNIFKFVEKIKEDFHKIKIVLCTSRLISSFYRSLAASSGFDAIIYYPLSSSNIKECISKLFVEKNEDYNRSHQEDENEKIYPAIIRDNDTYLKNKKVFGIENFKTFIKEYATQLVEKEISTTFIILKIENLYLQQIVKAYQKIKELNMVFYFNKGNAIKVILVISGKSEKQLGQIMEYVDTQTFSVIGFTEYFTANATSGSLIMESSNAGDSGSKKINNHEFEQFPKKIMTYPFNNTSIDEVIEEFFV